MYPRHSAIATPDHDTKTPAESIFKQVFGGGYCQQFGHYPGLNENSREAALLQKAFQRLLPVPTGQYGIVVSEKTRLRRQANLPVRTEMQIVGKLAGIVPQ